MLIIGTSTSVEATSRHGQFFCPRCKTSTTYAHARRRQRFFVWFVPLMTLADDESGIVCMSCGTLCGDDAIDTKPPELAKWACPKCSRDWPETNVCCPICRVRPDGSLD